MELATLVFGYLALAGAATAGLVARARSLVLPPGAIARRLLAHLAGAALLGVGALAWLFNGYAGGEYGDEWNTLGVAVPALLAGAALLLLAWWPPRPPV
jgi:hypothetical protein